MKELIRFLAVCLLLLTQHVSATEVKDLFNVDVIAQSQSREDRNLALREALVVVLNRINAGEGLMLNITIRDALSNAASYVDQYQYTLLDDNAGEIAQRKMKVSFNEPAVMELMHRSGMSVWNKIREDVLVWIVIEQRGQSTIFEAEQNSDLYDALLDAAKLQGIPVLFPLMDLEERLSVSTGDIVNGNSAKIQDISRQYGVSVILSGKVIKQRSCWRSEWTLSLNNSAEQWAVPCENLTANLATAFQGVYERLSVYYAAKPK